MHTNTSWLIRNASAILTGLSGDQARHAGPDIRVSTAASPPSVRSNRKRARRSSTRAAA